MQASDIYKSINDEIIARLQARNRIILSYASVSIALIGVASSEKGFAFVAIGIGFYSLALNMLNRHHELLMARLIRTRQKILHICYNSNHECSIFRDELEGLNGYIPSAYASRDFAQLAIHGFLCVSGLLISGWKEFYAPGSDIAMHDFKVILWSLSFSAFLASMALICNTMQNRKLIWDT